MDWVWREVIYNASITSIGVFCQIEFKVDIDKCFQINVKAHIYGTIMLT